MQVQVDVQMGMGWDGGRGPARHERQIVAWDSGGDGLGR